jgi:hypothetical protein
MRLISSRDEPSQSSRSKGGRSKSLRLIAEFYNAHLFGPKSDAKKAKRSREDSYKGSEAETA